VARGIARPAVSGEWEAVAGFVGWKAALLALVALALLAQSPRAAAASLAVAVGTMTAGVSVAGPASLLWVDLHLQTAALLGLLVGASRGRMVHLAATGLGGLAVWLAAFHWDLWAPLLSFNLVGLAFLAVRRVGPSTIAAGSPTINSGLGSIRMDSNIFTGPVRL
jgi:hypothetical protein